MARKRKSPKVVWLPPFDGNAIGGAGPAGGSCYNQVFHTFAAGAGLNAGTAIVSAHPLTFDQPNSPSATQSLAAIESSGYRLRRIVGKIWVDVQQTATAQDAGLYMCTAAMMVREVDSTGVPTAAAGGIDTSPNSMLAQRDPWIWRRSWLLANGSATSGGFGVPANGVGIASSEFGNHEGGFPLNDGPHIDQKTARVIRTNQRLFLEISTTSVNNSAVIAAGGMNIRWIWETRCLASMRTMSGNRGNAAR